jgi:ZIP family zinc transporter
MFDALIKTCIGTGFVFLMTAAGAAMVFLFTKRSSRSQTIFLGFAAGVMIAASVWSLLIPALEAGEKNAMGSSGLGWIPAAGGFIIGVLFMLLLDKLLPHLHPEENQIEGIHTNLKRSTLLMFAVTLHNIPEGMAVGLSYAAATQEIGGEALGSYAGAFALAIGLGLQNFPEGAAVSLPLYKEGLSKRKAFTMGALSGIVEPIFGIGVVLISSWILPIMPWLLAFAAGAMMYVVVEELIPEAHADGHSHDATISILVGFLIMMVLDVVFGA